MSFLGYSGQPADIADVVTFLVSEQARWSTGQNTEAGGGVRELLTSTWHRLDITPIGIKLKSIDAKEKQAMIKTNPGIQHPTTRVRNRN